MKKTFFAKLSVVLFAVMFVFSACNKDKTAVLQVKLTDSPAGYDEVNIDIQGIVVKSDVAESDGGGEKEITLERTGVFNVLKFTNGIDTLLGELELPAGKISQIRLILGSNNSVVKDGQKSAMDVPSGSQSGLKLNLHETLEEGVTYKLWLDFDAERSVVEKGNGKFSLKPTIRTFAEATSGAIKGVVSPAAAEAYVMTVSGTDTIGTVADAEGKFLLRGVPAGTFEVTVKPNTLYNEKKVSGIAVELGKVADAGTVTLTTKQ